MEARKLPTPQAETRTFRAKMSVEEGNTVTGYAAVFNKESEDMGWFSEMREIIMPGAFDEADMTDVRALFNHDPNLLLARTSSGTMQLEVDSTGLRYTFKIPDTQAGRDLRILLDRGDISQSSFGFTIAKQSWDEEKDERGETIRVTRKIEKIARLFDVSPVTYPAYPDTSVALRSLEKWRKEQGQGETVEKEEDNDTPLLNSQRPLFIDHKQICTMRSVAELRHEYLNLREQMRDLVNRAKAEKRDLHQDENEQFLKMHNDQQELEKAIEARTLISGMDSEERGAGIMKAVSEPEDTRSEPEKYLDAYRDWVRRGSKANPANLSILEKRGTSTITTETTGLIYGGYTVPETLDTMWTQTLKAYGGMMQVSRVLRTSIGGTWNHVYTDDTSTAALLTAEASATTLQDFSFSRIQLNEYTYRSAANFSLEFIQDESINVLSEVNSMLATRMGRALNAAFTTGDGSGKPTGLLAASGGAPTGKSAASATAITSTEILDLIHSVDPAYRQGPNVRLMFNDSTLAYIKKLQLGSSDSSPLWVPSMREGEPSTIWGYPYTINQDFPTIASGAKTIAFGDFSYYIVREVRQPTFVRLNELYMANLTQGFLAFGRYDAKLIPVGAIKLLVQA